ncbi:cation-independent mannose-6-phosphate receptor isoform X3 [Dendroctonus ponderosae]|uniref:cation-independent mannose-6-phosphate receptor isoform X3 n=1 Tax=Dendroctonus ponderosae TaxID=77166 RepID=UPI002034DDC0|nr:cation-independent mannose-6-phosphate receptor isoform X3 [Dendroctonus ponderosae]
MCLVKVMFCVFTMMEIGASVGLNNYCIDFSPKKLMPSFINVTSANYRIIFDLCKSLNVHYDGCKSDSAACLMNLNTNRAFSLGTAFTTTKNGTAISINSDKCTAKEKYSLVVHFNGSVKRPILSKVDGQCQFHIDMRQPLVNRGITIYGEFIDLTPLARSYRIQTPTRNFSINIDRTEPSCRNKQLATENVNACQLDADGPIPLSQDSHFSVMYNGEKNLLFFSGRYSENYKKAERKIQIDLVCNWDKTAVQNNDLTFVPQQNQGKKYWFKLETALGCISHTINWVIQQNHLIFNVSNVCFESRDILTVDDLPLTNETSYYIHFCGPGHLPKPLSKVTETLNGIDINKGTSVLSSGISKEGFVEVTIIGKSKCMNSSYTQNPYWKTQINFSCDEKEHGPRFLETGSCYTYFLWKSPHACPKYNASHCTDMAPQHSSCIFRDGEKYFNLSSLDKTHTLKDKNLEFKFNVCGAVIDKDVPCTTTVSLAMINTSEIDIRKKFTSLGKYYDYTEVDGNLKLLFITGSFCGPTDYHSSIIFECAQVEENPILLPQRDRCNYEFRWRTQHACPYYQCMFTDSRSNIRIHLQHVHPIKLVGGTYTAEFHVCERFYSFCASDKNCTDVKFGDIRPTFLSNMTSLDIFVDIPCKKTDDFNQVTFNFICEDITYNEHFGPFRRSGCNIILDYYTSYVCRFQNDSVPRESAKLHFADNITRNLVPVENRVNPSLKSQRNKCLFTSPFTDKLLNPYNLTNNESLKKYCPIAIFNDTYRFVKLVYNSSQPCKVGQNMSYEIYLLCTNTMKPALTENTCLLPSNYTKPEYCNFFIPDMAKSSLLVPGSIIGCIALVIVLVLGLVLVKRGCCIRSQYRSSELMCIYEKKS